MTSAASTAISPARSISDARPDRSQSSRDVLDFARRMVAHGSVVVTSPSHPALVEHRIACHDTEAPGYTVVFLSVTDGAPEVTSLDFDLADQVSMRHLPHGDGLGLTMCDVRHHAVVTYRLGG